MRILSAQLAKKTLELTHTQGLREGVGQLMRSMNIAGTNILSLNLVPDKMTVHLNLFRSLVKYRIGSDMQHSLTVIV